MRFLSNSCCSCLDCVLEFWTYFCFVESYFFRVLHLKKTVGIRSKSWVMLRILCFGWECPTTYCLVWLYMCIIIQSTDIQFETVFPSHFFSGFELWQRWLVRSRATDMLQYFCLYLNYIAFLGNLFFFVTQPSFFVALSLITARLVDVLTKAAVIFFNVHHHCLRVIE